MIDIQKLPNAETKLTITIEASGVSEIYEKQIDNLVLNTSIKGFRKGKAPREMVMERTDVSKIHGDVISELLKKFYPQAIKEKSIFPYSNPKIEVKEFEIGKDFIFEATIATKPEVKVADYKKIIKDLEELKQRELEIQLKASASEQKAEPKTETSAENNTATPTPEEMSQETPSQPSFNPEVTAEEIINTLVAQSEFEISELIINEETDRLLERFISQVRSLNLNVDSLLRSQNKTYDDLLADHKKIAEANVKSEFILNEIIKEQKIEASEQDILDFVENIGDEGLKNRLLNTDQKWFVKATIEKNRAIAYLKSLVTDSESPKTGDNHEKEEEAKN